MIASLRGKLRRKLENRVVVESAGVGYEVFLPPVTYRALSDAVASEKDDASDLSLVIYYHATRDQPRPILIGFTTELDKEFFEKLITVKDIGPLVAARALTCNVPDLAAAIARQDEKFLRGLPGIGPQKARNMVAQLQAKVAKYALVKAPGAEPEPLPAEAPEGEGVRSLVWEVLVKQLGHRPSEAARLIEEALRRRPGIGTAEELFDEIYRGGKAP
jgi:Holliday junction DNA helicase RuvA